MQLEELKKLASQVRRDIVRMVHAVQSGHPGGSLGCTEYMVALYNRMMEYNSSSFDMDGKNEDVFFLSNGHISPVFYSVLAHAGYFPKDELNTFRKIEATGAPYHPRRATGCAHSQWLAGAGHECSLRGSISKKAERG